MFDSVGIPHGFCFLWNPGLLWLHVVSDSLIALAYFLIPIVILQIVQRRQDDVPHLGILACFGAFIVACGITHVLEVITLWHPIYWVSGAMKAFTAAVSLATFFILARLAPGIVAIPSNRHLDEANQRLNSVLESTLACVYAVDSQWRMIYLNGNAKRIFRNRDDLCGRSIFESFPGLAPESVAILHRAMATRKPIEFESFYKPMDLSTKVSVTPSADGGLTVFFTDISEQKRLETQLHAEQQLRERRIRALTHMAGSLAHEISNPLGIIHARASNLMEMIEDAPALDTQAVGAACESIVKTSDRAMRTLHGLRSFAREGSEDVFTSTRVGPLLERTIHLVHPRFVAHSIDLTTSQPAEELSILCSESQIEQALLNLLSNAFDAVNSLHSKDRWIKIVVKMSDVYVMIHVSDGGAGIPPEHKPYLMKPFFTTKPVGGGIGVGLSLAQAIAHDHGGSLVLTEDVHTCFCLTLPRAETPRRAGA